MYLLRIAFTGIIFIPLIFGQEKCSTDFEFLCQSGHCIRKEYLCDGSKECPDGSDETTDICKHRSCSQSLDYVEVNEDDLFLFPSVGTAQSFRCQYGACISVQFVCDGIRHCVADGSDEWPELCKDHECARREFRCNYGACIPRRNACDNRYHCADKSDETKEACRWRGRRRCYQSRFQCSYGSCIHPEKKCNLEYDCLDGSDESVEVCGPQPGLPPFNDSQTELPTTPVPNTSPQPSSVNIQSGEDGCFQTTDFNIRLEILSCGNQGNCDGQIVPVGSVMLIYCERVPTPLECKADGKWHFLREVSRAPRTRPCQDEEGSDSVDNNSVTPMRHPLPTDCGVLPMFSPMPWLVGLFRNGNFACTGTLIAPSLVLTAGHCIIRNQVTKSKIVSPNQLKIQFYSKETFCNPDLFASVSLIRLHPKYTGSLTPKFDVALLFLEEDLAQSHQLPSACLDQEGTLLNIQAWTFNRTVGQSAYSWESFPQFLDTSCFNMATKCSRHLNIGENQFCGVNKESTKYLHPGSSGGPYFISKTDGGVTRWSVAGVVSNSVHTSDCGTPHTVFTSVSKLYSWIVDCGFRGSCK